MSNKRVDIYIDFSKEEKKKKVIEKTVDQYIKRLEQVDTISRPKRMVRKESINIRL